jgi:hypothetical protein
VGGFRTRDCDSARLPARGVTGLSPT